LVNHLQAVVVDIFLVQQIDIFYRAIIKGEVLDVIFGNSGGFFNNTLVGVGKFGIKKLLPLTLCKRIIVELFQLGSQIVLKCLGIRDRQLLVCL